MDVRVQKILQSENSSELCERFTEIIAEEFETDTEPFDKKGRYLFKAIADGSVEDFILALTGWNLSTLLDKLEGKKLPNSATINLAELDYCVGDGEEALYEQVKDYLENKYDVVVKDFTLGEGKKTVSVLDIRWDS